MQRRLHHKSGQLIDDFEAGFKKKQLIEEINLITLNLFVKMPLAQRIVDFDELVVILVLDCVASLEIVKVYIFINIY